MKKTILLILLAVLFYSTQAVSLDSAEVDVGKVDVAKVDPTENSQCAKGREILEELDIYILENFSKEAIDKQRTDAYMAGLISSGTGRGGSRAAANFDAKIGKRIRENKFERLDLKKMLFEAGC